MFLASLHTRCDGTRLALWSAPWGQLLEDDTHTVGACSLRGRLWWEERPSAGQEAIQTPQAERARGPKSGSPQVRFRSTTAGPGKRVAAAPGRLVCYVQNCQELRQRLCGRDPPVTGVPHRSGFPNPTCLHGRARLPTVTSPPGALSALPTRVQLTAGAPAFALRPASLGASGR